MKSVFNTIYRGGGERAHTDVSSVLSHYLAHFPTRCNMLLF